jgi:hypothetical protein
MFYMKNYHVAHDVLQWMLDKTFTLVLLFNVAHMAVTHVSLTSLHVTCYTCNRYICVTSSKTYV